MRPGLVADDDVRKAEFERADAVMQRLARAADGEFHVPLRQLGVEGPALARQQPGVGARDRTAPDDDAPAARIHEAQQRAESAAARQVGHDQVVPVLHGLQHAHDLLERARHEACLGGRGAQTLKLSSVSRANSSSGAKRFFESPCSWW